MNTPITIHQLAIHRGMVSTTGNPDSFSGADYAKVGLAILGGCERCGATLAAYNAHPSKTGSWRCGDCIGPYGWHDVAEADEDIFDAKPNRRCEWPGCDEPSTVNRLGGRYCARHG